MKVKMIRMWRRIFWLLASVFVFCPMASRSQDRFDEFKYSSGEEWSIVDTKNPQEVRTSLEREIDRSRDEIDANKVGCWRYCVKKKEIDGEMENKETIKRVNIIWNVVDEARVTLTGKTSNNWGIPSGQDKHLRWESSIISSEKSNVFYDDNPKCELFLELGCKSFDKSNSSLPNAFSNSDKDTLISKNDVTGLSSSIFSVDEETEKLRILVFGKLSQVVLEVPIARRETNVTDATKTRPMFSLSRTNDAKGLLIDAHHPPSGEWRFNLLGMENSNYSFIVTAIPSKKNIQNSESTNEREELDLEVSDLLWPQRLENPDMIEENSARATMSDKHQTEVRDDSTDYQRAVESYELGAPSARASATNETNFGETVKLDAELTETDNDSIANDKEIDINARLLENSEFDEFSRIVDNVMPKKITVVDIDPNTELILRPGTIQDVVFTITNNQPIGIRHTFRGSSQPFTYVGVLPNAYWIRAGETINVAVRIIVPNIENPEPNKVTLYVGGNDNLEVVRKSAYVYVQGARGTITTDSNKPNIAYSFNDNCAWKLYRDRCARSRWSVEITVHDPDSGLRRVTSLPTGIQPFSEFISGTKNRVTFYYSSTCCYTTVDITATDVQGNYQSLTIDVTAWDNLSPGEIAAIVVGALLVLLLIILIIVMIIYCIRKRKSHDLSYSQRYGSRTPASAERSNF